MIAREEILRFAPTTIGEEVKGNHEGCPAGLDTKRRLYVKRVTGGLVAYCHHCSGGGFVRDINSDGTRLREWLFSKKKVSHPGALGMVTDAPTSMRNFRHQIRSMEILAWLHKYQFDLSDEAYFKETESGDLYMPLKNYSRFICGFQIRCFASNASKYLTFYYRTYENGPAWFHTHVPLKDNLLVITEDYASARRVNRDIPNVTSMALLRTTLSLDTEKDILDFAPKNILVWLDPDKAGQSGAAKIAKRLRYLFCSSAAVRVMTPGIDEPKKFSPLGLQSVFHTTMLGAP